MIPNKYLAILTYGMIVAAVVLTFGQYRESVGYQKGQKAAEIRQVEADRRTEKERADKKDAAENEYRKKIEAANADRDRLSGDAERLRAQISNIRRVVSSAAGVEPGRQTTTKIAGVLAELFGESVKRNEALASEAERYRAAGELCERQYDEMRVAK